MKTQLKAKFLLYLSQKQPEAGFTLIEVVVVFVAMGVLTAIAIPSFINQTVKAKQAEAKKDIGLVNRAQVAYRTENNSFATSFDALALGTLKGGNTITGKNYSYVISGSNNTATIIATALDSSLRSYSGGNSRNTTLGVNTVISSIVCEAKQPGIETDIAPIVNEAEVPRCRDTYNSLN